MDDGLANGIKVKLQIANGSNNCDEFDANGSNNCEFDFDQLEVHSYGAQTKKVAAFAAQRRRVKPARKHVASTNPVKILRQRQNIGEQLNGNDVGEDYNNNELVISVGGDERNTGKHQQINGEVELRIRVGGDVDDEESGGDDELDKAANGSGLIGRHGQFGVGKIREREYTLTNDAKKGLESKEDIHGASLSLRVTEKDHKTGIGTEKTNIHDGVNELMLFHIKGARNIQTRLVEPKSSSLNSGDVFVLITQKSVFQWNGKNCSIMEKARGAEICAVISQWKELGCNADKVIVIDEGHEKCDLNTTMFWKLMGEKEHVKAIDDVFEDKEFEKSILESNCFYEIKCKDIEDENAECWLEEMQEYSGIVPSKKWLQSEKAYVLDFGTEVYSWIGRNTIGAPRKKAIQMGLNLFNKGYESNGLVHPFNLNEQECYTCGELLQRPDWCVYGRMCEKTENVAFRRKFFDWPDPVDLKVKTVAAKIHSQLTKDYTNENESTVEPITAKLLTQPIEEPLMILDGSFIGRGRGMKDMETLFQYGVTLNELTIWQISANFFEELPKERYGIFYSAEAYVLKWNFEIFRTGIRHLKGGKSRQEDAGKSRIVFFFWQGKDCTSSEKGQAALRTIELNTDEGPQVLVPQGKEPPAFFQLFDGKMVVHSGKFSDDPSYKNNRMYWVRNEVEEECCLVEVPITSISLRSRTSFIIADMTNLSLHIWHGAKSSPTIRKRARSCTDNLSQKCTCLHTKQVKIHEMNEGDESDAFWECFGENEDYISFLQISNDFKFTPRCFSFDNLHGYFRHVEVISSTYHPDYICPFPILQSDLYDLSQPGLFFIDAKYKLFLWEGWWPSIGADDNSDNQSEKCIPVTAAEKHRYNMNRKLAMQTIKAYTKEVGVNLSHAYIVCAGCEPLEFKNLFPYWTDVEEVTNAQVALGKEVGAKYNLIDALVQLERDEYTLTELTETPLPEGVDPTRIEQYLSAAEFEELFQVNKDGYKKLPRWKQIELKKTAGLF